MHDDLPRLAVIRALCADQIAATRAELAEARALVATLEGELRDLVRQQMATDQKIREVS
jgi:hypothetical protein